ncbi:unnamed protein product [Callosobruchus maculatus]|uniref:Uncharacterized protein n=1 Tax=Callosobruchus maculatus TaxID=64391 RepID=A0A653BWZ8_CALMS|nr:unnamed protein product [Callosobruchus maculatus]VEN44732.1 unnamed protein product [Callosobruchus maculatus]
MSNCQILLTFDLISVEYCTETILMLVKPREHKERFFNRKHYEEKLFNMKHYHSGNVQIVTVATHLDLGF